MTFSKLAPFAAVLILATPVIAQTTATPTYTQNGQTRTIQAVVLVR